MTYQAREPNTPMRRWQERCEETYARDDRMTNNERILERWKTKPNTESPNPKPTDAGSGLPNVTPDSVEATRL